MYIIEEIRLHQTLLNLETTPYSTVVEERADGYKSVSRFLKGANFKFKLRDIATRETIMVHGVKNLQAYYEKVGILGTYKLANNKLKFQRITLAEYALTTCLDYVGWSPHKAAFLTSRDIDKADVKLYLVQEDKEKDYLFFEYIGEVDKSGVLSPFFASYIYNMLADNAKDYNRLIIDKDCLYIGTFTSDSSSFITKYYQSGCFIYKILDRRLFDSLVARYSMLRGV